MSPEKISKRQERREKMQRQQQRQRLIVIGLIVLGAALVVFAVIWPQIKSPGEIITVTPVALPNPNGLSLGDANAPATIEVFEDFQCPACQSFTESIEPLVIENLVTPGKARYVFHNYPFIDGSGAKGGGESDQASNAAMCANEQGKFWEMHSTLYANWNGENKGNLSDQRLQLMAKSIGLDMDAFDKCFSANKYEADIQADFDKGLQMGVNGTPTVFVNGKQVGQPGKIASYDEIKQAVDAINPG
ncbi:MAG TPA: thioredoxin domain-containing protein [Anaerolineales bacterium]